MGLPTQGSKGQIAGAAGLMSIATFISRILGYVKDMILARYFGATAVSDVFFVAFRIPNLLRELFAEGAMSSAFIPVLTDCHVKDGAEEAKRLVRSVFAALLIILCFICIAGALLAPQIVLLMAPGFAGDPEKFASTVLLTRIMFPFLLFISLSSLVMGVLNTRGIYFVPALAPALLNVVTIISVIFLAERLLYPIAAVAVGVTVGGFVQFLFQLPTFYRQGFSLLLPLRDLSLFNKRLKRMALLLMPATAGMAVSQINIFVSTIFASFLQEGSVTALYYSMRLIQFPIGIFGVAIGMAALPALSRHAAEGRMDRITEDFSFSLRLLFFITVPAMFGLIALREPIVNLLFQHGLFDYNAALSTSSALMYYSLGIWAIVGLRVCTAAFYSLQDTASPVKTAALGILINILFSYTFMSYMGHNGLALANSLAAAFNFVLLFFLLRRRLGVLSCKRIALSFLKSLAAALVMAIAADFIISSDIWKTSGQELWKSIYLFVTITMSVAVYLGIAYLIKCEEVRYVLDRLIKKSST